MGIGLLKIRFGAYFGEEADFGEILKGCATTTKAGSVWPRFRFGNTVLLVVDFLFCGDWCRVDETSFGFFIYLIKP